MRISDWSSDVCSSDLIGSAFATITKSLSDDIIMPVVGYIFGGVDFSGYFIVLGDIPPGLKGSPTNYAALKAAGVAMFGWGAFLKVVINFLILAFIIFLIVRQADRKSTRLKSRH